MYLDPTINEHNVQKQFGSKRERERTSCRTSTRQIVLAKTVRLHNMIQLVSNHVNTFSSAAAAAAVLLPQSVRPQDA